MSIVICSRGCAAISGRRLLRRAAVIAACIAAYAAAVTATAATLTYPGAAPCSATLQACIDGAGDGDTLELAFDVQNTESLDISNKSLALRARPGNAPQIGYVSIVADAAVTLNVSVQGIASIKAIHVFCSEADLNLSVRDNTFASNGNLSVHDRSNSSGHCAVDIDANRLSANAAAADPISVQQTAQALDVTIRNNAIVLGNMARNGGISIYASRGADNRVSLERNRISGSAFGYGISVRADGGGDQSATASQLDAVIVNNLVTGQAGEPGGITVHAAGFNATIAATIVNNTVVDGAHGIAIGARGDGGSAVELKLHNNLIAYHTGSGIGADSGVELVSASNNLSFGNRAGADDPFAGTFEADPQFVDRAAKDYALGAASPAINAGSDAALPVTFTLDAAGNARRVGTLDIGAFESAPLLHTASAPLLSPAGSILLCAALLALGLQMQRRAPRRAAYAGGSTCAASSSQRRNTRAMVQSRLTVAGDNCISVATSSIGRPAK